MYNTRQERKKVMIVNYYHVFGTFNKGAFEPVV